MGRTGRREERKEGGYRGLAERRCLVRRQGLSLIVPFPGPPIHTHPQQDPAGAEACSGGVRSGEARAYAHQDNAAAATSSTGPPSHPIFNRQKSHLLYTLQRAAHTQGPCAGRCHPLGADGLHTEDSMSAVAKVFCWRWGRVGVECGWRWNMGSNIYLTTED